MAALETPQVAPCGDYPRLARPPLTSSNAQAGSLVCDGQRNNMLFGCICIHIRHSVFGNTHERREQMRHNLIIVFLAAILTEGMCVAQTSQPTPARGNGT